MIQEDKKKVFKAIKELFNLKGIYYNQDTDEPVKTLTDYICSKNYRLDTALQGIKRLEGERLTEISNDRLEESIKAAVPHNPSSNIYHCRFGCEDMGIISMVDEFGVEIPGSCLPLW